MRLYTISLFSLKFNEQSINGRREALVQSGLTGEQGERGRFDGKRGVFQLTST